MLLALSMAVAAEPCPDLDRWIAEAPAIVEVIVLGCDPAEQPARGGDGPLTLHEVDRAANQDGTTSQDCRLRVERTFRGPSTERLVVRRWSSLRDPTRHLPWVPGARVLAFARVDGDALVLHDEATPSAVALQALYVYGSEQAPAACGQSWSDVRDAVIRATAP